MEGLEHAQKALTVFAEWAERVREKTGQTPQLVLFADGSGRVCDNGWGPERTTWFHFGTIDQCLETLNKLQASKQFARPRA